MPTIDLLYDPYALLFGSFWIFWSIYFIFNLVLFFKHRHSFYIKSRAPWLIFCSAVGQYFMMTTLTFRILTTPAKFPNIIYHWYVWGFLPLHMLPYPIRSLRFIILYNVNIHKELSDFERAHASSSEKLWDFFRKHPKYITDKAFLIYLWVLMAICIIVGLILNITTPITHIGHYGTPNTKLFLYWITCLLGTVCILLFVAYSYIRKVKDELYYNVEIATITVLLLIFNSLYIIYGWCNVKPAELQPISGVILCVSSFLVSFGLPVQLAVTKPPEVNYGSIMRNMEDVMEPKNNDVDMKNAKKLFKEFLVKRSCEEGYLFYNAVLKFRKEEDPHQRLILFRKIKEKFISNDSIWQINIDNQSIDQILELNENTINNDVLNDAFDKNKIVLETDQFPIFKCTKEAKELVNSILQKKVALIGYHQQQQHQLTPLARKNLNS